MNTDPASTLQLRLRADLKVAMRERRASEISCLRSLIAAIDNAQAVPLGALHQRYVVRQFGDDAVEVPRMLLSDAELDGLIDREISDRTAVARELRELGQAERAARLTEEVAVIERYVSARR